jgi:hypothetical protein
MSRPDRDRAIETGRVADRNRNLPDAYRGGVSQRHEGQAIAGDADHGDVGIGIVAEHLSACLSTVRERHADMGGAADDVAVGDEKPVVGKEKAGARALTRDIKSHDCRSDDFGGPDDGRGIGVEKIGLR